MSPHPRLVLLLVALALLGLGPATGVFGPTAWNAGALLAATLVVVDWLVLRAEALPQVTRRVPGSLALGVTARVELRVRNTLRRAVELELHDVHPLDMETEALPLRLRVAAGSELAAHYTTRPLRRGDRTFGAVHCTLRSPLGLWWRRAETAAPALVRVYPNFAALGRYALLAMQDRLAEIGVRQRRRRGLGAEFQQLREFRQGDTLRQVDWRASARMRKLISREYQDQRDQSILLLLDCGRRMRAQDGALSHFDEALNAVLLLAYVALHKGDAVGVSTFGGQSRWFAPVKGHAAINRMQNQLYDLQPGLATPDYPRAATALLTRHQKHALVILVTNLRDEDVDDVLLATRILRQRHTVLLASTRETAIDRVLAAPVHGFGEALRLAAAHQYRDARQRGLRALRADGVSCVDVTPGDLSVELVNTYLAMKARGAL